MCAKIVIIRPGALGDVLVARGVLVWLGRAFPGVERVLVAPGVRGGLMRAAGWAETAYDYDLAMWAWLFSRSDEVPPDALAGIFSDAMLVVGYGMELLDGLRDRLGYLAPEALLMCDVSRPPEGMLEPIGEWLIKRVAEFCSVSGLALDAPLCGEWENPRMILPISSGMSDKRYLLIHPGSGSARKNWPVENFIKLADMFMKWRGADGLPLVEKLVVTAGEADGDAGRRLAEAFPDASLYDTLDLRELSELVAGASYYLGNDSGVSHLASAVRTGRGTWPKIAVFFISSEAKVWAPPGAAVLRVGSGLSAAEALSLLERKMLC